MDLKTYREREGKSQQQAADDLGLKSKSSISGLENGTFWPSIKLALQIEKWTAGELRAVDLLTPEDADLLRRALASAHTTEAA